MPLTFALQHHDRVGGVILHAGGRVGASRLAIDRRPGLGGQHLLHGSCLAQLDSGEIHAGCKASHSSRSEVLLGCRESKLTNN